MHIYSVIKVREKKIISFFLITNGDNNTFFDQLLNKSTVCIKNIHSF